MSRPMVEWTVGELLDAAASAEPTPSAGSVAAVSAALGMGLVAMGFEIAAQRHRRGKSSVSSVTLEELTAQAQRAGEIAQSLLRLADDDQAAVRGFLRAQRTAGPEATRQSLIRATEIPLAAARVIYDGLALAEDAARSAPPPVRADVAAGATLLRAALAAMLGSVESNLALLPEDALREGLAQEMRGLSEETPGL